jgi:serine/threonine-protein kinase
MGIRYRNGGSSDQQPPIVTDTAAQAEGQAGNTTPTSPPGTHTDHEPSGMVGGSSAVEQPRPADGPSAQIGTQTPRPWWQRQRPQVKLGLIAATVVIVVVVVVGYLVWPHAARSQTKTAQPSTTSPPSVAPQPVPPVPPVAVDALEGLWLSPDQINTAMGAAAIPVQGTSAGMADQSALVPDKACIPMQGPAQATAYTGSGWRAMRLQRLGEPANATTRRIVEQAVVLFSSAHDAGAFFTAAAQGWPACANRQYTFTQPGHPDQVWTAGPVSNTNGTLSATETLNKASDVLMTCQRALTVANNVAIDVMACAKNPFDSSDPAISIVHQIAAKVPH